MHSYTLPSTPDSLVVAHPVDLVEHVQELGVLVHQVGMKPTASNSTWDVDTQQA